MTHGTFTYVAIDDAGRRYRAFGGQTRHIAHQRFGFQGGAAQLVDDLAAGVVAGRRTWPGQALADGGGESPVDSGTDGQVSR